MKILQFHYWHYQTHIEFTINEPSDNSFYLMAIQGKFLCYTTEENSPTKYISLN